MERIFAIGDIHGCRKTFEKLITDKIQIEKSDRIYCIGDYIDRGNDSKGVIDYILELRQQGYQVYTLRGNHEQMMLDAIPGEKPAVKLWLKNGGKETLESFGIKSLKELPEKYSVFLKSTELIYKVENYIFVHAGLNFDNEDIFEDKESMMWTRGFYPQQPALEDRLLIHGHTPIPLPFIFKQSGNCINIDAGCVYQHKPQLGNLVAIDVRNRQFLVEENCE